ncbi:MAG: hypothetical protein P4M13_04630 [Alphaproteobacteria bacterium]|nr:hypothetical protein [Alphaproteobacteria bacterium]
MTLLEKAKRALPRKRHNRFNDPRSRKPSEEDRECPIWTDEQNLKILICSKKAQHRDWTLAACEAAANAIIKTAEAKARDGEWEPLRSISAYKRGVEYRKQLEINRSIDFKKLPCVLNFGS